MRVVKDSKYLYSELYCEGSKTMPTTLGDRIRDLRKKKGFTLDQLAEASKSSKSYIWELENKDPPRPSGEKLALIAEALGVTGDFLLGVDTEPETAEDKAFFRKYQKMESEQKQQIREMLDIISRKRK